MFILERIRLCTCCDLKNGQISLEYNKIDVCGHGLECHVKLLK